MVRKVNIVREDLLRSDFFPQMRFKYESEKLASRLKMSGDPW